MAIVLRSGDTRLDTLLTLANRRGIAHKEFRHTRIDVLIAVSHMKLRIAIACASAGVAATALGIWLFLAHLVTPSPLASHPLSPITVPDAQTEERADHGDVTAQLALGQWHLGGEGRPHNYAAAARWLGQAASAGNPEAQTLLGTLCQTGAGMELDLTNARRWFESAAAQNHAGALYNLGSMYAAGRGVEPDSAKAAQYYQHAAELGDPLAQFNVAQRYELGRGVATNLVAAWKWYELALAGGVEDALRGRKAIELKLTGEELREARRAAREFRQAAGVTSPPAR